MPAEVSSTQLVISLSFDVKHVPGCMYACAKHYYLFVGLHFGNKAIASCAQCLSELSGCKANTHSASVYVCSTYVCITYLHIMYVILQLYDTCSPACI